MNEERYTGIKNSDDYSSFNFISEGRYGKLVKVVRFDDTFTRYNTYNLALGTVLSNGKVDFESITNNGDRNKILATVALIIYVFLERYPDRLVYITGSDFRRTLLYQRAINYQYDELIELFNIFGDVSEDDEDTVGFEPYQKTKRYDAFLIEKK